MSRLVLLSGWGCDARIWEPLAPHWSAGVEVSTPDWPGYGDAAPLATPDALDKLAATMAPALPGEALWVGWSLGGLLAAALLEHLPPPRGLVLLGCAPRFTLGPVSPKELAGFRRAFARDPHATWRHFLRHQLGGEPAPRQAHVRLRDLLGETPPASLATLEAGLAQLAQLDIGAILAAPPCPIRRLRGARDPLLPSPQPDETLLEEAGHCPQLSRPAALARHLEALLEELSGERLA